MSTKVKQNTEKTNGLKLDPKIIDPFIINKAWLSLYKSTSRLKPIHTHFFYFLFNLNLKSNWLCNFKLDSKAAIIELRIDKNTLRKILKDFIELGFLRLLSKSKNQYYANVINIQPLYIILYELNSKPYISKPLLTEKINKQNISLYDKLIDQIIEEGKQEINNL